MDRPGVRHLDFPPWTRRASLVALVLAASATSLVNGFVQDDLPIVKENLLAHTLRVWHYFTESYWPSPYPRELYRPLTSSLLSLEWVVGGGHPVLFRIVSILLYIGATLAVYRLATRILPAGAAWLAAAWFAVHPVHVEAVAVGVNQAELVVGTLCALLVAEYIDRRRAGLPLSAGWMIGMAFAYLVAALFKEHAILLPLLLVAAELTVIPDPRPWGARLRALRPFYLLLALMAVSFVWIRSEALGGDTKGSFTAEALQDLTAAGRARTMLGVVPQWARLFFWPDHLRADYSPQEIVPAKTWTSDQTAGVAILVAAIAIAWYCRRRRPAVTFGVLWMAVGLALVSNLIIPLGIVLAERTLFLATIGLVLAASGPIWDAGAWIYQRGSAGRIVAVTGTIVLLAMAASRSASRQTTWRNVPVLWAQAVIDAPRSYRAEQAYGSVLFQLGSEREAMKRYQIAMQLFPKAWPVYLEVADQLRRRGHCVAAIRYYRLVLALTPNQSGPRASEIACLLYDADYRNAALEARLGISFGMDAKTFGVYAQIADSADRIGAPPHSVNLPAPIDSVRQKP